LEDVLPKPLANPVENDLARNAMPYATALAAAIPRYAPSANLLPPEYRRSNSRAVFVPSAILATLVLLTAGAAIVYSGWSERRYAGEIQARIARLEPERRKAEAVEKQTNLLRGRSLLLDDFRKQTRADLDALNELTRIIEPPAWTTTVDILRDNIR